jgi:hypothetical protein
MCFGKEELELVSARKQDGVDKGFVECVHAYLTRQHGVDLDWDDTCKLTADIQKFIRNFVNTL